MIKRLLFFCLTLLFFISATSNVSADNKIIRKKTVRNATITAGNRLTVFARGKTLNTKIMNGGIEDVFAGAVSQNAKVFDGGRLWLAGGKSYGATVEDGGLMEVREHRGNSSYSADTKILSKGRMNVFNRSLAEKITVHEGGLLRVYLPKSLINDVTVLSGGVLHVWKHGTAQNVYVAPGGLLDLREESPVLKGTIRIAGQLKASFDQTPDVSQAEIIIDLTRQDTQNAFSIVNLDYLGNANISVKIAADQKNGLYRLASEAENWQLPWYIKIGKKTTLLLAPGKVEKYNGKYYKINRRWDKSIELIIADSLADLQACNDCLHDEQSLKSLRFFSRHKSDYSKKQPFEINMSQWQLFSQPDWHNSLDTAFSAAEKERKNIFILLTGPTWCSPCRKMEKDLFPDRRFKNFAAKNLVLVYFAIPYTYKSLSQKLYHDLIVDVLNMKGGVPCALILDTDGRTYGKILGFSNVEGYMQRISKILATRPAGKPAPQWIKSSPQSLSKKLIALKKSKENDVQKADQTVKLLMEQARFQIVAWGVEPDKINNKFDPNSVTVLPANTNIYWLVHYKLPKNIKASMFIRTNRSNYAIRSERNNGKSFVHRIVYSSKLNDGYGEENYISIGMTPAMPEAPTVQADIHCKIKWKEMQTNHIMP